MTETKLIKKVSRIKELEEQAAQIQKEIDLLKSQIKDDMQAGNLEEVQAGDYRISWKEVFSNRIDSKKLKAELPDVYSRFLSINVTRRFLIA